MNEGIFPKTRREVIANRNSQPARNPGIGQTTRSGEKHSREAAEPPWSFKKTEVAIRKTGYSPPDKEANPSPPTP